MFKCNISSTKIPLFFLGFIFTVSHLEAQPPAPTPMKPEMTEFYEPVPAVVTPGKATQNAAITAPSDAIVLFDGKNMDKWVMAKDGTPPRWVLDNGVMTVKLGDDNLQTKQKFWRLPTAC